MAVEKGKSKQKYGFYLNDETTNMIDTHLESAQTNNRSKFVEKAIHHYSAYLDTGHNKILGNEIIRVMRDIMHDQISRVSRMLFKVAVEISVSNYLKAANVTDLSEPDYQKLRYYVAEQVRKTKGTISLEYALADEYLVEVLGCQE